MTRFAKEKDRVFISFAWKDGKELAEHLKQVMDSLGFSSFIAPQVIAGGFPNPRKLINSAIDTCEYFIVILTKGACESENVGDEILRAKKANKTIISCKENELSSEDIPKTIMKKPQWIPFENKETLARKVISALFSPENLDFYETGISHVFLSRRRDSDLAGELEKCITHSHEGVLMMGISFRDFFGRKDDPYFAAVYEDIIEEAIRRGVKFKVLLIDPTSWAAKRRAIIESGEKVRDDKEYMQCQLFEDIKRVAIWLNDPQVEKGLKCRMRDLIEVRFYDSMPSMFTIKTDDYTFIEQYHIGNLKVLGKEYKEKDVLCLGGYVPLFKVEQSSSFCKLIRDHFENIWKDMESNNLQKVLEKLDTFEKDPRSFRTKQFLEFVHERSSDLLGMKYA